MLSIKKILVPLTVLFFITDISFSQEYNYGISIGYNRTTPQFNKEQKYQDISPNNYFNVMGFLEVEGYPISRARVGLKYFKIGYSSEYKPDDSVVHFAPPPVSSGSTVSFLAFPIDFNYILPFLPEVYFSGGLQVTFLLSATTYSESFDGNITEWDNKDRYRYFNVFLMFGIGAEYKIGNFTFFIEPEYSRSIRSITKSSDGSSSFVINQFSLSVGLKI